jgi:hypothetical protein
MTMGKKVTGGRLSSKSYFSIGLIDPLVAGKDQFSWLERHNVLCGQHFNFFGRF